VHLPHVFLKWFPNWTLHVLAGIRLRRILIFLMMQSLAQSRSAGSRHSPPPRLSAVSSAGGPCLPPAPMSTVTPRSLQHQDTRQAVQVATASRLIASTERVPGGASGGSFGSFHCFQPLAWHGSPVMAPPQNRESPAHGCMSPVPQAHAEPNAANCPSSIPGSVQSQGAESQGITASDFGMAWELEQER